MKLTRRIARLILTPLTAGLLHAAEAPTEFATYGRGGVASQPPAGVTYSFPAPIRIGGNSIGEGDSLQFQGTYVHGIKQGSVEWLLGVNWQRFDFSKPAGAPLPGSLQSAAVVLGADWQINDRWHVRGELLPGIYSDFHDFSAADFNAPLLGEISYRFNPRLEVGVQFNLDALRDSPFVAIPGVRWRFADQWVLALWLPRPQLEFHPNDRWTAFGGLELTGGSYRVARDFGNASGRPRLNGQPVDYREVRVGGGLRYVFGKRFAAELAGGWTIERQFDFHRQDLKLKSDGAPYVQFSVGLVR